jgi:hypothetical protein
MDASRLLAVVNDIDDEMREGFSDALATLVQQYTLARDTPTQDNTAAIQDPHATLVEYATKGVFAEYPPSKLAILDAIQGSQVVGPGFQLQLNEILSVAGQTTAGIVTKLTELQADLKQFQKACTQTKTGLQALGVSPHALSPGEFEAGILIPQRLVDSQLGPLTKQLDEWNKIVRAYQEIAGENEREVLVASLVAGSYEVYVPLGIAAAVLLAKTIDRVLSWYKQIPEIRKLRLQMQSLGGPTAEAKLVKKHERDTLDKNIAELAAELVKDAPATVDSGRRHELETQITVSIRQIARFVDKGGIIEVYAAPPDEPEEPPAAAEGEAATPGASQAYVSLKSTFEQATLIRSMGSAPSQLPERSEPILQLGDDEPNGESPSPEPSGRRKS